MTRLEFLWKRVHCFVEIIYFPLCDYVTIDDWRTRIIHYCILQTKALTTRFKILTSFYDNNLKFQKSIMSRPWHKQKLFCHRKILTKFMAHNISTLENLWHIVCKYYTIHGTYLHLHHLIIDKYKKNVQTVVTWRRDR